MARIIWIVLGLIGAPVTNEILYTLFNVPGGGVNVANAAKPAIGAAIVLIYCFFYLMKFIFFFNFYSIIIYN